MVQDSRCCPYGSQSASACFPRTVAKWTDECTEPDQSELSTAEVWELAIMQSSNVYFE